MLLVQLAESGVHAVPSAAPLPAAVLDVLGQQNPWHRSGEVPTSLALEVERPLARSLWQRLTTSPRRFHLILGPRRVGKTTAMYQTVRHLLAAGRAPHELWWIRLDHPALLVHALGDLVQGVITESGASPERPIVLLLDEVVYARDWDLWLKTMYDEQWPVEVVATSSATAAIRRRHQESGVGRWDEHHLTPYTFDEYLELIGTPEPVEVRDSLAATLRAIPPVPPVSDTLAARRVRFTLMGGFPELLALDRDPIERDPTSLLLRSQEQLRSDAVERAVYKDIPQSFGIDNPMVLERLLYVLAGQMGGILSPSSVSSDLDGLSQPTIDRYVSYLEQAFLIFQLQNYSGSESVVQRRGRKIYFWDGAVRTAALQRGLAPLNDPVEMGHLTENLVAATMHAFALHAGHRLFYWREGKKEVDLILDDERSPLAIEVGSSPRHTTEGLRALVDRHPRFSDGAYLVAPGAPVRHPDAQAGQVGTLPLERALIAIGAHAQAAATGRLDAEGRRHG